MPTVAKSSAAVPVRRPSEFLHWIFQRDGRTLSCSISIGDDLACTLHILPLWGGLAETIEKFTRPVDAIRRHAEVAFYLRESGWLLGGRSVVRRVPSA